MTDPKMSDADLAELVKRLNGEELIERVDSLIETLRFNAQNMIAERTLQDAWAMLDMARQQWSTDVNSWIAFRELLRAHLRDDAQAATAIEQLQAEVGRLRAILNADPDWLDEDEDLVDAFHAELKRQGAFSIERHGLIALGMAPFMSLAWRAARARANPHPTKEASNG